MTLLYEQLTHLLRLVFFWLPPLRKRVSFEVKNRHETLAQSFKRDGLKADIAFEFSSEGEYQQIAPLVTDALKVGKSIELVFFSPSVEKTIIELAQKFPKQIRYLRYPIATLGFRKWITSETLVLVRYDLFPEFLLWAQGKNKKLKMVWISFKRERLKNKKISWIKKKFLKRASSIVFASEADREFAREYGLDGMVFDFRIEQIGRRVKNRLKSFEEKFSVYPELKSILDKIPHDKKIIMGNAWPIDLHLLKDVPSDYLLLIVPHQLKPEILDSFNERLKAMGRNPVEINDSSVSIPESHTYILNKKGVLCELYSDFGFSYVGGGFGASIHSVLEPLVAGSEHISCGPVNSRSTEFDLAQDLERITEVNGPVEFQKWLSSYSPNSQGHDKLNRILDSYEEAAKGIVSC